MRGSFSPQGFHRIFLDQGVFGKQTQLSVECLCYEHPVERVAVDMRKRDNPFEVKDFKANYFAPLFSKFPGEISNSLVNGNFPFLYQKRHFPKRYCTDEYFIS